VVRSSVGLSHRSYGGLKQPQRGHTRARDLLLPPSGPQCKAGECGGACVCVYFGVDLSTAGAATTELSGLSAAASGRLTLRVTLV
jgi:hypothetical protein